MLDSNKKLRISILLDWNAQRESAVQLMTGKDGHVAAFRELARRGHVIQYMTGATWDGKLVHPYFDIEQYDSPEKRVNAMKEFNPDTILFWSDMTRETIPFAVKLGKPMAVCFAGGSPFGPYATYFDLVFVESEEYKDQYKERGFNVRTAFGTDEGLYRPIRQTKIWDAFFPAVFADWKRHNLFAEALGTRGLAAGWMNAHETHCYEVCFRHGVSVLPHVSSDQIPYFYGMSRTCVIPSKNIGGSQRTALEAMACNVPVIACRDSAKISEYINDATAAGFAVGELVEPNADAIRDAVQRWKDKESNGRDYIMSKWSLKHFADALEDGLKSIVKV